MSVEIKNDDKESLRTIYSDSVKLLELLNILIPQIGTFTPKVSGELLDAIVEKCWELGGGLSCCLELLSDKKEADNEVYPNGM